MSDPQIVDAIEGHYVPVCIYNNIKGKDAQVLSYFKEATWNYPVTRIVDLNRKDVVARSSNWRNGRGVVKQLISAMKARNKTLPGYLELMALNNKKNGYETAVFGMS